MTQALTDCIVRVLTKIDNGMDAVILVLIALAAIEFIRMLKE